MLEPDPELAVAYGIFSVRQARAAGYSEDDIRQRIQRGRWVRWGRGRLEVVGRDPQAGDPIVRARLAAGPHAVVGFLSAAVVHGWDLRRSPDRVCLIRPLAASTGVGYRAALEPDDVVLRGVVTVTSPLRTALDAASTSDFETAVITLDSAMRTGQVTFSSLQTRFAASNRQGVRAARRALASADPLSGSVPESEARLLFARAGLPAPSSQFVVRSGQRFIARLDFVWEEALLVVEIDGFAYHSAAGDFQHDRTQQNAVQLDGWLVLRFTVADIRDRPHEVVAAIRRGLVRRLLAGGGPC